MSSLDAAASATDEQPKPEFVYKTNPITGKQYKYFPYQPNKMLNKGIKHVEVFFDMAPQRPQPIRIEQFIPTNYNNTNDSSLFSKISEFKKMQHSDSAAEKIKPPAPETMNDDTSGCANEKSTIAVLAPVSGPSAYFAHSSPNFKRRKYSRRKKSLHDAQNEATAAGLSESMYSNDVDNDDDVGCDVRTRTAARIDGIRATAAKDYRDDREARAQALLTEAHKFSQVQSLEYRTPLVKS